MRLKVEFWDGSVEMYEIGGDAQFVFAGCKDVLVNQNPVDENEFTLRLEGRFMLRTMDEAVHIDSLAEDAVIIEDREHPEANR